MNRRLSRAVVSQLTKRQREYIELYYYRNMTMPEIARAEGINVSSVSRTLSRARMRLKRALDFLPESIK